MAVNALSAWNNLLKPTLMITWNDVTFDQYVDILDVYDDTELDDADRAIKLCGILFGVDIRNMPLSEYGRYVAQLSFLDRKMPKAAVLDHYEINGTRYRLIRDVGDITVAMYFDFNKKKALGSDIRNYPEIMACFFVPEGKEYGEGYDLEAVKDDIRDMPVPVVNEIANFWVSAFKRLIRLSLAFLRLKTMKLPKEERKAVRKKIEEMEIAARGAYSLS